MDLCAFIKFIWYFLCSDRKKTRAQHIGVQSVIFVIRLLWFTFLSTRWRWLRSDRLKTNRVAHKTTTDVGRPIRRQHVLACRHVPDPCDIFGISFDACFRASKHTHTHWAKNDTPLETINEANKFNGNLDNRSQWKLRLLMCVCVCVWTMSALEWLSIVQMPRWINSELFAPMIDMVSAKSAVRFFFASGVEDGGGHVVKVFGIYLLLCANWRPILSIWVLRV